MSDVKQLHVDYRGCSQKRKLTRSSKDKEVNFEVTYECHPNYPKTHFMNILRCFKDHQMWPQNWTHVWTSLCEAHFLWTSSLDKLFDFFTYNKELEIHLNIFDLLNATQITSTTHTILFVQWFFPLVPTLVSTKYLP